MTNKKLIKRVAPIVMSVAVAMTSMPMTALAEDFTDSEVVAVEETAETAEAAEAEASDGEAAEEEAFGAEAEEETAEEAEFAADTTEETTEEAAEEAAAEEDVNAVSFDSGEDGVDFTAEDTSEYHYVYAGLTWAEYWASEGVYAAGDTSSSTEVDKKGEADKGAFDAVTRATTNHGLHRGSFQTITKITGTSGKVYSLAGWEGSTTMILTDGSKVAYSKGTMTFTDGTTDEVDHYNVYGLKYVPVKVKTSDYADFIAKYDVVENGGTIFGGYGEVKLVSYSETANVTESTNGLKVAVKNADGSFSFSARTTGTDSGIKDQTLKTATGLEPEVKAANGNYGEFLRVDFNGDYGDLGSNMQAVKWTYYGTDSTYTKALASYGTKFAADNWMHKSMGIQLGLTNSIRCQLPEGYTGTGYWSVTIYALGYEDYTYNFQATKDNIVGLAEAEPAETAGLEAVIAKAEALSAADYTKESWDAMTMELEECKDMVASINADPYSVSKNGAEEQVGHLTSAIDGLVKASLSIDKTSATAYVGKTVTLKAITDSSVAATWTTSDEKIATVDANGKVTAKKVGTATITATLGNKSVTCKVTVKAPSISVKASASTIYTAGQKTATIKVTKNGATGTAKFASSKTSVATVSSKGVVTAKKAGTTTITVTVGSLKKTVKITVKKPGLTLTKSSATLKKGKTTTIKYKATPSGKATFKSSNTKVATVSSTGKVTAKKAGTAKITVKVNGVSKTFTVKVK